MEANLSQTEEFNNQTLNATNSALYDVPTGIVVLLSIFYGAISLVAVLGILLSNRFWIKMILDKPSCCLIEWIKMLKAIEDEIILLTFLFLETVLLPAMYSVHKLNVPSMRVFKRVIYTRGPAS